MKKSVIILGAVILVFILLIVIVLSRQQGSSQTLPQPIVTPTQIPNSFNPYNSPDHTTQNNIHTSLVLPKQSVKAVIATFGNPAEMTTEGQFTVYSYPLPDTTRVNKVYVQNQKVTYYVKEVPDDNTFYSDYAAGHNTTEDGVLYDRNFAGDGFEWYVFSEDGIAFLANKDNGYALKILYFPKMPYTQFLQTTANDFSLLQQNPDQNEGFK